MRLPNLYMEMGSSAWMGKKHGHAKSAYGSPVVALLTLFFFLLKMPRMSNNRTREFSFWLTASGGKGKLDLLFGSRILFANRVHFGVEGDILIGEYNWMHNRLTFS